MAESSIEWTDFTWNPIRARDAGGKVGWHCEKVSPACQHCYAETFNGRRLPNGGTGLPYTRSSRDQVEIFADDGVLRQPFKWKKPRRIFVCSMTDLFGEFVPFSFIDRVFAVMNATAVQLPLPRDISKVKRWHAYQVLTKRPDRAAEYLESRRTTGRGNHPIINEGRNEQGILRGLGPDVMNAGAGLCLPLPNVWIGATVENQERADKRIPHLLKCPAAVRFLSVEPMLGPINLRQTHRLTERNEEPLPRPIEHIDWVIAGGESGRDARPLHPDCVRDLRDQCTAAGVPFFFKQWGQWSPLGTHRDRGIVAFNDGRSCAFTKDAMCDEERRSGVDHNRCHPQHMYSVGKKAAGRQLDGVEHSEFPVPV